MQMSHELYSPPSSSPPPPSSTPTRQRHNPSSSSSFTPAPSDISSYSTMSSMSSSSPAPTVTTAASTFSSPSLSSSFSSGSLKAAFDKLVTSLSLEKTDYADVMERSNWSQNGYRGTINGGKDQPNRLTWYNYASIEKEDGSGITEEHLNVWVGCLVDVPHLHIMVRKESKTSDQSTILLDFIPREDIGYTANRYMEKYYLSKVHETLSKPLLQNPGSFVENIPPTNPNLRLLLSPTYLYGSISDNLLSETIQKYISTWESWMTSAEEVQRMKRGQLLSRDTGLRRAWFDYQKERQASIIDAKTSAEIEYAGETAAALSGPQQMAYTGQAS